MSFKFKPVAKRNPQQPTAVFKFYASPVYTGEMGVRDLVKKISLISTVSSVDTLAVLEALLVVLPQELIDGYIVKLRDFGTFRISLSSEGVAAAEDLTSHHIKKLNLLFRPSKEFSELTGVVKYEKA